VYLTSEPISITNAAGITFLSVCCAATAFMVWFFLSLTRERRPRHVQCQLQVRVKATDWETSQVEKIHAERPVASVKTPIHVGNRMPGQTPKDIALDAPSRRRWG
jgi:hypothetical protein